MLPLFVVATAVSAIVGPGPVSATKTVVIRGRAFQQKEITIAAGDQIFFSSEDGTAHKIFSASTLNPFPLRDIPAGGAATVAFAAEGTTEVRCALHPAMKMTVMVK